MRVAKDRRTKKKILYFTSHELNEKDISLIGEVALGKLDEPGLKVEMKQENLTLNVHNLSTFKRPGYKILGYIESKEPGQYVLLKRRRYPWLILLLLLLLLIGAGIGWRLMSGNNSLIDPNAFSYESKLKRPENIDSTKILIPGYGDIRVKQGSNEIDTVLFNPEGNPCYFQFTLTEKESGKTLYESKLVEPGKGVGPLKCSRTFDSKGEIPVVLKFKTVDFEDPDITYNGSEISFSLIVE